ncbi:MAG: NAD-dependent epimerase/dehydratase family protein [Actinobacteria bacterium]|nr:MAG: NAD-dependent epimerase/dehydratase family protein [Actinomycetota bacterium]
MNAHFPSDLPSAGASRSAGSALRTLVTGASGAVGSLLAPRLLLGGHAVRTFGRDVSRIEDGLAAHLLEAELDEVEVIQGDVLTGEGLARALKGVDVAYYLMHSMERSAGEPSPFTERARLRAAASRGSSTSGGSCRGGRQRPGGRPGRATLRVGSSSSACCWRRCRTRSRCAPRS